MNTTNTLNTQNKSVTLLFNPSVYLAGAEALALGLAAILLTGLIGWLGNTHFDGVLDAHLGGQAPLWVFMVEGILDWLCLAVVLLVLGKIISRTEFRAVDVLGTQAFARWPALLIGLILLPKEFQRIMNELVRQLNLGGVPKISVIDGFVVAAVVVALLVLLCWMVTLMYRAFSISCNVKGGKAIGTFIVGVLLAEIISKICVGLVLQHAGPSHTAVAESTAGSSSAISQAAQPVGQTAGLSAAGSEFVDLLAKKDFAGAEARFDSTMKSVLPEAKLRAVWEELLGQVGPYQKQLRTRVTKQEGYDVVFVTCQFENKKLDTKVVFDDNRLVGGLFFEPTHPAPKFNEPPPYARTKAFREKDFTVGDGKWRLPGTLTLPGTGSGPWPCVVLVHGSGPEDRDETIGASKPFRDLAWGLASKGIAVLRYEKRTKQYADALRSGGVGQFTVKEETIDDALSAVARLRATESIDPKRIFVLGHSLGGMLAPRIGQSDPKIAGLIMMAGCLSRPFEDLIVEQVRYLISLNGKPSAEDEAKLAEFESIAAKVKKLTAADYSSSAFLMGAPAAYWLDLREHDSLAITRKLGQPLLILQGGRDYQANPADFQHWKEALGAQPNVTFKLYPRLNHLFIAGEGKSTPGEYENPGHVAEAAVTDIAQWIKGR